MNKTLQKFLRDKFSIRLIGGSKTTLFQDLIKEQEKSFTSGDEVDFIDIFFEGGEDLIDNSRMLITFSIVIGYFVHFGSFILANLLCFGDIIINGDPHEFFFLYFGHPRYDNY